jgi:hypothetical protein
MYNRKERRRIEKDLGITKLLKSAPKEVKDIILQKRKEENLAMQQAWKEEQEAAANEREVQRYAKQLQFYTETLGYTHQEAEKTLQEQRLKEEERAARKRKNKE